MPVEGHVGRRRPSWRRGRAVEKTCRKELSQEEEELVRTHLACFPPLRPPWENYSKDTVLAVPQFCAEQSMRIAKVALDYYNRKKKIKFELEEFRPVNFVPTKWRPYIHVNFIARSRREGSVAELFFAELYLCGKRRTPSGYSVICCEPLVYGFTPGLKDMDNPAGNLPVRVRKNLDFTHCYACGGDMLHPKGTNYVGGHCIVPGIYQGDAML